MADGNETDRGGTPGGGLAPRVKKAYAAPTLVRWGAVEDLTLAVGNVGTDGVIGSHSGG